MSNQIKTAKSASEQLKESGTFLKSILNVIYMFESMVFNFSEFSCEMTEFDVKHHMPGKIIKIA